MKYKVNLPAGKGLTIYYTNDEPNFEFPKNVNPLQAIFDISDDGLPVELGDTVELSKFKEFLMINIEDELKYVTGFKRFDLVHNKFANQKLVFFDDLLDNEILTKTTDKIKKRPQHGER